MAPKQPKRPTKKAIERWEDEGGPVAPTEQPKKKRPRDLNQWAKRMVDVATMDEEELAKFKAQQQKPGKKKPKSGHTPGKRGSVK